MKINMKLALSIAAGCGTLYFGVRYLIKKGGKRLARTEGASDQNPTEDHSNNNQDSNRTDTVKDDDIPFKVKDAVVIPEEPKTDDDLYYIITGEKDSNDSEEYSRVSWNYYWQNDVYVDERDEKVDDPVMFLGPQFVHIIMNGLNPMYIRNEVLKTDFEIIPVDAKYEE